MAKLSNAEDFGGLKDYLLEAGRIGTTTQVAFRTLSGGVSNRVVLIELSTGERWVLKQALDKLRVPVDWYCAPERSEREASALSLLAGLIPDNVADLVFADGENHLLAMKAVPEPHANWKELLMSGIVNSTYFETAGHLLGAIHRHAAEGVVSIPDQFANTDFFDALRVEPYYSYTASVLPETATYFRSLVDQMEAARLTIVHGDFSPKNVLIDRHRLVLLDHEVVHVGDPAFDVGFFLAHILSKAHHLRTCRNELAQAAQLFWDAYIQELEGCSAKWKLEPRAVRHILGCLLARVAGRSQLEYLSGYERSVQKDAVLSMLTDAPSTISMLIKNFLAQLERRS
jgi:tRNA A-37 threonylcarbamoyl transferase component Bud32